MKVSDRLYQPLRFIASFAGVALFLATSEVQAQSTTTALPAAPRLEYQSVLNNYRSFNEQPVQGWREHNDRVRSIGGWRTYAREAPEDKPEALTAPQSPSPPAPLTPPAPLAAPTGKSGSAAESQTVKPANLPDPGSNHRHGSKP